MGRDADHWERARREIEAELQAKPAGHNSVPEANVTVHQGANGGDPEPGFGRLDGLTTPGVPPVPRKA